ncbi:MAG: 1-phosphofructokinase family hexose kinase [Clostridiales bacterium]|jgi:1-phosphofructokinase|nr:1-phosphofructokinase family hexose kinase [Clostridiales bacterium]
MIATVTLNPCRDKTQVIERFARGGMNRVLESRQDLCGKGINVSVALAGLGEPSVCLGFNFERDAAELVQTVNRYGIKDDFILCPGAIRVNIKLFERDTGVMTEINEPGDFVSSERFEALKAKAAEYGGQADIITFSGSAPKGLDEECYAELIASARKKNPGVKIILDAEGPRLINGLKAKPDIIKPNLFELETAYGVKLDSNERIVSLCGEIIAREGIKMICVSMGGDGAVAADAERACFAPPLPLKVRGLQGAGDSMVAGICAAIAAGKTLDEILRYAVTTASGSIEREGTLLCEREDFARIYPRVSVYDI